MKKPRQRFHPLALTVLLLGALLSLGSTFARHPIERIQDITGTWKGTYIEGDKGRVVLIIAEDGSYGGRVGKAPLTAALRIVGGNLEYHETSGERITLSLYERGKERLFRGFDEAGAFRLELERATERANLRRISPENTGNITIGVKDLSFTPPPRTIDNIRQLVGALPRVPDNCAQIQAHRRDALDVAFAGLGEGPDNSANLARIGPFVVAIEWELTRGNFKRAIELTNQAVAKVPGQWLALGRAHLYTLLARIEAALGDADAANAGLELARKQWGKAVGVAESSSVNIYQRPESWKREAWSYWKRDGLGTWIVKRQHEVSAALGDAVVAQARGELALAESHYRKALAGQRYTASGALSLPVYADTDQLNAELTANLWQQGRLAEAERQAHQAMKNAFTYHAVSKKFTARSAQLVTQLATVYLEQGRLDDAEYLGRLSITMHEVDCALPGSLSLVRARQVLAHVLAAKGDWQGVLQQAERVRAALADDPRAFERLFGSNVEWALALIHSGQAHEGFRRLEAALQKTIERNGADSYEAGEMYGLLAMARAVIGDQIGALRDFSKALPIIIVGRDQVVGTTGEVTRSARASRVIEVYMKLLTDLHGTTLAADAGLDTVAALLRVASVVQLSSVQSALAASAARAAARDAALGELVRRDQDTTHQINATLDTLAYLDTAPSDQVDWSLNNALREQVLRLRTARVKLAEEIRRRFPEYAELMNPRPATMEEIRAALRPDEALLAFHVATDRTYVWAIPESGKVAFAAVDFGRARLGASVARLRQALDPRAETLGDIPAFDLQQAWRLYEILLKPVEPGWKTAKHLWVVPHGALGQLPLSVLPTAPVATAPDQATLLKNYQNVPWLVRTHSISVLPSVASLITLRALSAAKAERRHFVGFGDPYFSEAQAAQARSEASAQLARLAPRGVEVRGLPLSRRSLPQTRSVSSADLAKLPRLPDTAEEVRNIARALRADPARDIFLGAEAAESKVKNLDLSDRRVIAFATHGLVPGDLDGLTQPALALASPAVTGDTEDGLLTMGEILGLKLNADWVVLSACNTAAAEGKGAEAVSGLGRAFFYAGARALLVSNWPVETTSAKALTTDIFRRQGKDPSLSRAEALRQAMLYLIDGPGYLDAQGRTLFSYAHPIFWAPFSLVGDGGGNAQR